MQIIPLKIGTLINSCSQGGGEILPTFPVLWAEPSPEHLPPASSALSLADKESAEGHITWGQAASRDCSFLHSPLLLSSLLLLQLKVSWKIWKSLGSFSPPLSLWGGTGTFCGEAALQFIAFFSSVFRLMSLKWRCSDVFRSNLDLRVTFRVCWRYKKRSRKKRRAKQKQVFPLLISQNWLWQNPTVEAGFENQRELQPRFDQQDGAGITYEVEVMKEHSLN